MTRLIVTEDWTEFAACTGKPFNLFFPEGKTPDYTPAKMTCAGCPVRADCLAEFLNETDGVYGGFSPREREALRRGARAWDCPDCGLPMVVRNPDAAGRKHSCRPALFGA